MFPNPSPAYQSAMTEAAFYVLPDGGVVHIAGADRLGFVQRQTTNDTRLLAPGSLQLSVLTNPAARILDVFYLFPLGETLGVLCLPGRSESTYRYLKSRIFFMDKVTLSDESQSYVQVDLIGPAIEYKLQKLGIARQPGELQWLDIQLASVHAQLLKLSPALNLGVRLLVSRSELEAVTDALAASGMARLTAEEANLLRLEAGLPAVERELNEQFTPLEANLTAAISESKGCYTGQEVIARQITYDKVTQSLCGLRLAQPAAAGQQVWAEDKPVGELTSAAVSPRFGAVALAYLKRPHNQVGSQLSVGDRGGARLEAAVVNLPFQ